MCVIVVPRTLPCCRLNRYFYSYSLKNSDDKMSVFISSMRWGASSLSQTFWLCLVWHELPMSTACFVKRSIVGSTTEHSATLRRSSLWSSIEAHCALAKFYSACGLFWITKGTDGWLAAYSNHDRRLSRYSPLASAQSPYAKIVSNLS